MRAQRETRDQKKFAKWEIKNFILLPHTKKKISNLLEMWRTFKYHRALQFFVLPLFLMFLRCFINGVLLFSSIMLLKLHLFHSSLSQFTPLFLFLILSYSSFPLSFSSFLFLSLSLSLSLLRYSWRVKRPAANVVGTKARAQNSLSLCLWSKIKKITKRSSPRRRFRRPKL